MFPVDDAVKILATNSFLLVDFVIALNFNSYSAITEMKVVKENWFFCLTIGYLSFLHHISVYLLRHRYISHLSCPGLQLDLDCPLLFSFHAQGWKNKAAVLLALPWGVARAPLRSNTKFCDSVSMSSTSELGALS